MNPPTVEFVKDALPVARAATKGPWRTDRYDRHAYYVHTKTETIATLDGIQSSARNHVKNAAHIAKFDPPTVIALLEDWLRLREALEQIAEMPRPTNPRMKLYNDGLDTCEALARAALAKQG